MIEDATEKTLRRHPFHLFIPRLSWPARYVGPRVHGAQLDQVALEDDGRHLSEGGCPNPWIPWCARLDHGLAVGLIDVMSFTRPGGCLVFGPGTCVDRFASGILFGQAKRISTLKRNDALPVRLSLDPV